MDRDGELAALRGAWLSAAGGTGRLMVLEGPAGAGKSASLAAMLASNLPGARVLRARGTELETEFAFSAMRQLFGPVLMAAPAEERTRLLAGGAAPAAWALLSQPTPSAHADAGAAVLDAIYWVASNLAQHQPLLLVVDDLHWVDPPSLRALIYLAGRLSDLPIMLCVALRVQEPGTAIAQLDELRVQPGATALRLGALDRRAVDAVVRRRVPGADDAFCAACAEATAGNPLYLTELLRELGDSGGRSVDAVRAAALPSLGDRLTRRIARVDPQAPGLTAAMAVVDDGGRLRHAAAIAGIDEAHAARIALQLRRIEVLDTEDPIAFVHPLVRRSIYDDLSVTARDALHRAAGEHLRGTGGAVEVSAAHLASTRPTGSPETASTLVAAAHEALGRAAPDMAMRWLRRALAEDAANPPRAEILAELGFAGVAERDPETLNHLRSAHELAVEPALRARLALTIAELLAYSGQWVAALAELDRATSEHRHTPDLALEFALLRAGFTSFDARFANDWRAARDEFAVLSDGKSWTARALAAIVAVSDANRCATVDVVRARIEHALAGGHLMARNAGGWASGWALSALVFTEQHDRALEACDALAAAASGCGSMLGRLVAEGHQAWIAGRRGDLAAAEAAGRAALEKAIRGQMPLMVATSLHMLADALLERPTLDDIAELTLAIDLEPAFRSTWSGQILLGLRGRIRLQRGDRDGAVADLRACVELANTIGQGPTSGAWWSQLALALPSADRDEALALVASEVAAAERYGLPRPHAVALRAAGILAGGDDGVERLRRSVDLLRSTDARYDLAVSQVELGAALRRSGRRREARPVLEAGMDLAHRCGAVRRVRQAQDELRATGARPRGPIRTGVDSLTPSEARVALLAARGRTNTEIAQELYVSLKTVETHLSHAYGKLDLRGAGARQSLADRLDGAHGSRALASQDV